MDAIMDAILQRRSIRRYKTDPIPDDILGQLLEAVRWSPSWANTQCWEVVVIRSPETKVKLQEAVGRNPAKDAMVTAPVVLVLCAQEKRAGFKKGEVTTRFGEWFMYDLGIANQNVCLAAHALGLGTVIVGLFDHARVDAVLGLPPGYKAVTMVPLGYPEGEAQAPPRREQGEFVHQEQFERKSS